MPGVCERREFAVESAQIERGIFNRPPQRVMKITLFHRLKTGIEVGLTSGFENRKWLLGRRIRFV
jgi:hypothetical protein